ncbi:MAG: helix-hairpin-helix domain-containing protein [Candidatus Solibacter usitatus]|nr:helix-hairpin-helix domain-containing protein [Candidatus Solibacter usitatus]
MSIRFAAAMLLAPLCIAASYPDRPGKKNVDKLCGGCHGLKLMEPMRKTRTAWQASVEDMVTKGMKAEDDELEEVVNYFAKYFSRLNVNKASPAELTDVLDLEARQAAALVDYRAKNGDFKNFGALEKVPGVDRKKLAEQRDRIAFTTAAF